LKDLTHLGIGLRENKEFFKGQNATDGYSDLSECNTQEL